MEFIELSRTDNEETGAISIAIGVSKEDVRNELEEFYSVVAAYNGKESDSSWDEIDVAATNKMPLDRYKETRRDFVINRVVAEALATLNITPALTPNIHVTQYPDPSEDYYFELSVVERPTLTLSSYEPVEIETEDVAASDELVDGRISMLLESRAQYETIDDRPVVYGDCISVDIATISKGKSIPHLTGKKMIFELSDDSMPDAFVKQLIGMDAGETKAFEYSVKRAQAITDNDVDTYDTTVTVLNQLKKVVPQLTNEWVNANIEKAATVEEFREGVRQGLTVEVEHYNRDVHARLANIELEKRLQGKIPDAFYQASRNGLMDKLERELSEKGQTLDDYYEQNQMNEEELSVQLLIQSGENLRQGFALETLFDGRNMELREEDLRIACEHTFGNGSYNPSSLKQQGKYRVVESAAKRMVALNWLVDTATVRVRG